MTSIIYPQHYYVIKREPGSWLFRHPRIFYSNKKQLKNVNKREEIYGLTKKKITIELFRINAGKSGYYIANMRDGKYYYCGESWQNVRTKFLELGIGREDPMKNLY